jgi:hypothetical protein
LRIPVAVFSDPQERLRGAKRMDNICIVVESLDAAISFFVELGLELEGRAMPRAC